MPRPRPPRSTASASLAGVIGRYGDIVGVWIDPVIAQVMITLRFDAIRLLRRGLRSSAHGLWHGRGSHQDPADRGGKVVDVGFGGDRRDSAHAARGEVKAFEQQTEEERLALR